MTEATAITPLLGEQPHEFARRRVKHAVQRAPQHIATLLRFFACPDGGDGGEASAAAQALADLFSVPPPTREGADRPEPPLEVIFGKVLLGGGEAVEHVYPGRVRVTLDGERVAEVSERQARGIATLMASREG